MPGFLLHLGANVICAHAGTATPLTVNARVLVSGQPTVLFTARHGIAGCTMPPPPGGNGPCVTGQWITSALRVSSQGQPLLLQDSQAICIPTGTGLTAVTTQTRAQGT